MENTLARLKNKLKEENGMSNTIKFFIFLAFLFLFILFFIIIINIFSSSRATRDSIEQISLSIMQQNYKNTYHSTRESYHVGYRPNDNSFKEVVLIDEETLKKALIENLGLIEDKVGYTRIDSDKNKIFTINNIDIKINNDSIGSGTHKFIVYITYDYTYYIHFLNYSSKLKIPMQIVARYSKKY